ncbi:uncharacterized protein M6B38_306955 [Iris pallida]|uniref:RPA-interacting protein n=1 Tax=Iris pallida TaxID=29817 RepID=A0AAX6HJT1_IRIPA|nr:uncharacterized protein M6B38_306955 [Iris pallida]
MKKQQPTETKDEDRPRRQPLKANHHPNIKEKLRQNCLRRVREDRALLLWKLRSNGRKSSDKKEIVESSFRDIVSDELQKIRQSPQSDCQNHSASDSDDILWEYDGLPADNSVENESEELLIEMERILYEDLREEMIRRELEFYEEEDDYLAQAVYEHMQLHDDQVGKNKKLWCPICKQGELQEAYHLIYCTRCKLRLDLENDKVILIF